MDDSDLTTNDLTNDLAKASKSSYNMSKRGSVESRLANAQIESPENYNVIAEHSNKDMTTYKHKDDDTYIIAHRGTDLTGSAKNILKDVVSDFNIAIGNEQNDGLHKKRTKRTEKIIRNFPNSKIYLTGHSLGSSTANSAMNNSKLIRDNVNELHTFNGGSSMLTSKKHKDTSNIGKMLHGKSYHHTVNGDEISHRVKEGYTGNHLSYEPKKKNKIPKRIFNALKPLIPNSKAGKSAKVLTGKFLDTLNSHSIDNFIS